MSSRILSESEMDHYQAALCDEARIAMDFVLTELIGVACALTPCHIRLPKQPPTDQGDQSIAGYFHYSTLMIELWEDKSAGGHDPKPLLPSDGRWYTVVDEGVRRANKAMEREGSLYGVLWGGRARPKDIRRLQVVRRSGR